MSVRALGALLRRDERGAVAVEFALLGPLMIAMMLGVLQIGVGMHSYNALRGIAADTARYAVVAYQTSNELTNDQIRDYGRAVATTPPYGLLSSDVTVTVANASTQRISGAKELTFLIRYRVPSLLTLLDLESPTITYSRPIFVVEN